MLHEQGLHARPAAELIKIARSHGCVLFVKVKKGWQEAGIMQLLLQLAGVGSKLELKVEVGHEELCLDALAKLIEGR